MLMLERPLSHYWTSPLKEKFPTAIYSEWVKGICFQKITRKSVSNLGFQCNQELRFFKVLIEFMSAALSGGTLLKSVMSQQYSSEMELHVHKLSQNFTFPWKYIFLILFYVRAKIIVHAVMTKLRTTGLLIPKKMKMFENLYLQSQ